MLKKYLKGKKRDIHEDDLNHLRDAEKAYLEINKRYPEFKIIECVKNNEILPPKIIHEKIWQAIKKQFNPSSRGLRPHYRAGN